jgi:osmoprotectant transport system permease protein
VIVGDVLSSFGDALKFIFTSQESRAGGSEIGGTQLLGLLWDHVWLSGVALVAGVAVALPVGLWLGHTGRGSFIPLGLANVGRAVPSIALIVFFVAYLGTGYANVILALALLAVPPVLAGVSSLGDPIISFGVYGDAGRLGASIVVALLAVATELGLAWMQRRVSPLPNEEVS